MTLDGGWALILATILGVVLAGVGALIWRHVDGAQKTADEARDLASAVNDSFLKYQAHVAEHYTPRASTERMESNIFAVLTRLEQKIDRMHESGAAHG